MKKFLTIFSVFLFQTFSMNNITALAQTTSPYSEGLYVLKDLGLIENINYNVQNISPNSEVLLLIYDSQQRLKESVRLMPNSQKHTLLPIAYTDKVIILGNGKLKIST
jgi:hypothetical protein